MNQFLKKIVVHFVHFQVNFLQKPFFGIAFFYVFQVCPSSFFVQIFLSHHAEKTTLI